MINAVGRDIPEEILKQTGKEVFQGVHHFDGYEYVKHGAVTKCVINSEGSKLADSIEDVLVKCGIRDGMTVSFHHHFREGDYVVNMVMKAIHDMGIKDITICASSLGKAQDPLVEYIEDGTITNIQSFGVRGKIGEAISRGKLKGLAIMRSHGGRVRALDTGTVERCVHLSVHRPAMNMETAGESEESPTAASSPTRLPTHTMPARWWPLPTVLFPFQISRPISP